MPKRIQLKRMKGWRKPKAAVVVARPGKFGNPFTIEAAKEAGARNPTLMAVQAFEDWLKGDTWACGGLDDYAEKRQMILDSLRDLRGKDLACWCPLDKPCHADVLLRLANQPN
ncbi:MAG: DUF4326 domain-containing protein [Sulfitobacter sp.]|uniref:DUF4326 domain-containing protein n=1 Tax=Sulfitobacter sp. TaxID=1903071 RepID=UPI003296C4D0